MANDCKPMLKIISAPINSDTRSKIWAEGTDEQVRKLGGEHSAKKWAEISSGEAFWKGGAGEGSVITRANFETMGEANGECAVAEGNNTFANANNSHAEGNATKVFENAIGAHAEGIASNAKGAASHVEGQQSETLGDVSHAEGGLTTAVGDYSHTEGNSTIANNIYEHAQGHFNLSTKTSTVYGDSGNTLHSIGIGNSLMNRKNAVEVMQNGDVYVIGVGGYDGTNFGTADTLQQTIKKLEDLQHSIHLKKYDEYLYSVEYKTEQINYQKALQYFKEKFKPDTMGGCSTVCSNRFMGRNFDWTYNEEVSFVVKKEGDATRFASIGMCGGLPMLTKDVVETMQWQEAYDLLPYYLVDGMNEHGVTVSLNVVPTGDMGITAGTNPDKEGDDICVLMLPSIILERFATAREATEWVKNEAKVYAPNTDILKQELHIMVSDQQESFAVEFVNNEVNVIEASYMTNFYLTNTEYDAYGRVKFETVTPYGSGLERYNIIASLYPMISTPNSTISQMWETLGLLHSTHGYSATEEPVWKTEFVGNYPEQGLPYPNLTVMSPLEDFAGILAKAREVFVSRSRDPESPNYGTWQSTHSVVYDKELLRMNVRTQEQGKSKERVVKL